ncbi:hypothetical protein CAEBREN_18590 [Caenorhabditis brenneri]|uniref:Uncharacterized protein n=1 Tax=Caenorhabditis brenneri TaxID=135651 RepID=G0P3M2_CAEBE|nr:hypothetical protein CAEBREN_18590 [Caenorhabditis brenneri]
MKTLCFDDPLDSDFNPCNLDDSTCMPLEDFDQNCTCILLPDEKLYNFLRTEAIAKADNRWCLEGECNAFVYESGTVNRTIGIYSHAADLLQIIEYRGRSIFAVSSVYAEFSVPTIQRLQCEHKCKVFYWGEREMCMKQCQLRLQFDLISMTSDLKRNFDFFVQSSAIQNFRMKYRKFL